MGLGYEFPPKKTERPSDRTEAYGAWVTKYNNAQQKSFSWKEANDDKKSANQNNPWGPVFKNKQNFLDMHFC
ncbi:uncharacterized protein CEXT_742331 [Caerostris extrusa]|uniref:Uncharacterized protein n=1 Tax=Caerostris extrusa TaxID=172846 RepID=A0AAV4TSS4_CAEEX|nr:uncharacterized protein CEXT_742331 [Caerostris extrusa]